MPIYKWCLYLLMGGWVKFVTGGEVCSHNTEQVNLHNSISVLSMPCKNLTWTWTNSCQLVQHNKYSEHYKSTLSLSAIPPGIIPFLYCHSHLHVSCHCSHCVRHLLSHSYSVYCKCVHKHKLSFSSDFSKLTFAYFHHKRKMISRMPLRNVF